MSQKNNRSNNSTDFELFTPLIEGLCECIEILGKTLFELFVFLIKIGFSYVNKTYFNRYQLEPLKLKELKSKKESTLHKSAGYSVNHKIPFWLDTLNTKKHTAIIGSTGSGKTVCTYLLIEHALLSGKPVIYFDPKASHENLNNFKKICEVNSKKLYIFSDLNTHNSAFNPLLGGNLNDISDKIINSLEWSEPFYKNESIEALDDVLKVLESSKTPITLESICEELKKHKNFKNIKGLYNQLNKVNSSEYGELLNSKSPAVLSFNRLRLENACFYIGISAMGHSSSGSILNKMFFGGLLTHAKESLTGKVEGLTNPESKPISIFFDELSSTIHEGFIDLQNKCRQAGMEITYATQGPSDIDKISPTLTQQIFENTNNLFIFNQMVPIHTEFFAKMCGTVTREKKTHVTEDGQTQSRGTVRDVEEFLVHSNIFRNLKVGQCVLLQRVPKRIDLLNVRSWKTPIQPETQAETAF